MSDRENSFDLFYPKKGWKAETVLVVTPYVEREFFRQMVVMLRPKRLHVVLDDGCRYDDAQMLSEATEAASRTTKLTCVLGSAPGLVHLKLFYILWRTNGGQVARTLVFGSANATKQGFSGSINAELIASCPLIKTRHPDVIAWCESVLIATTAGIPTHVAAARDLLVGEVSLRLPKVLIGRTRASPSSFDLWIQRGYLLAGYQPEPGFLKVPVHLKRTLGGTEQSRIVELIGFDVPLARRLTYPYVGRDGLLEDEGEFADDSGGNWRSRLFTWTQFGYWCSEKCHDEHRKLFRRRGFEERQQQLLRLARLKTPALAVESRQAFIDMLVRLWNSLGTEAPAYLEGLGSLNREYYSSVFKKRVMRDLELADDLEFRERYLTGFEVAQVPRFRTDLRGWREFLDSMARQICLNHVRPRSQSRLLDAVRQAVDDAKAPSSTLDTPAELLSFLSETWQRPSSKLGGALSTGAIISDYHLRK